MVSKYNYTIKKYQWYWSDTPVIICKYPLMELENRRLKLVCIIIWILFANAREKIYDKVVLFRSRKTLAWLIICNVNDMSVNELNFRVYILKAHAIDIKRI